MKRSTLLSAMLSLVACLSPAACGEAPAGLETTEPDPGVQLPDPQFAASVETILKGRFPIGPRTVFDVCTGEWVDIVGEFNLVVREVRTPTGKLHVFIHSVGGHVTGVGQTTGTEYLSNEHFNFTQHDGGNGATNLLIEFTISWVSKGSAPNREVGKLQIFMVINANGEMTVDREVESGFGECQG